MCLHRKAPANNTNVSVDRSHQWLYLTDLSSRKGYKEISTMLVDICLVD